MNIRGKGKGIKATKKFIKGEYICEYEGNLITYGKAKKREEEYLEGQKRNSISPRSSGKHCIIHNLNTIEG